jgi:hypothetical protein
VVVCLVRNGRWYVDGFIDHHLRLGASHIVFLDNGSGDGTAERIAGRERVSLFACDLPYKEHKLALKRWLVRRFARGGWGLCVDADEHFDYPASSRLPLPALLRYLNARGHDAVHALLLDLFPREPLRVSWEAGEDWRARHCYYEIDSLGRAAIAVEGMAPIRIFFGGVRSRLGAQRVCLTKFPLLREGGRVRFLEDDAHLVAQATVADVSGLLLHYKFAPCFPARLADALAHRQYYAASAEYESYQTALRSDPDLLLWTARARRYDSIDGLAGTPLVAVSDAYRAWVEAEAARR